MTDRKPVRVIKVKSKYPRSDKPLAIEPDKLRAFVKEMAEAAHKDEGEDRAKEPAFKEGEGVDWPVGDIEPERQKG